MPIYQRKRIVRYLLLSLLLILALSFTAIAQAGGEDQPVPPAKAGPPPGKPPAGGPPMARPAGPSAPHLPELQNCIGVFTWYDGNLNGVLDANEDPMDGAKVLLMTEFPPPEPGPIIGPDGQDINAHKAPMGPMHGPPMPMAKRPMGPPPGAPMPPRPMPEKGFAKFQVLDGRVTRDGGTAVFCDLQPGAYILQGDAVNGITFGDNRQYITLEEGGYAIVTFGFTYLNGGPEATNGNGA